MTIKHLMDTQIWMTTWIALIQSPNSSVAPVCVTLKDKCGRKNRTSPKHSHFCMTDICRVLFRLKWHGWKPQLNSTWPYPQHVIFFPPLALMWIQHMTCLDPYRCPWNSQVSPRVYLLNACVLYFYLYFLVTFAIPSKLRHFVVLSMSFFCCFIET